MNPKAIQIPGGWNIADMTPCNLPQKAASAFSAALENLLGADYEPVLYVGTQIVNGTNYGVICKQSIPYRGGAYEHIVLMVLHTDTNGKPDYARVSITPIL